jgi:hypothetical protein
MASFTDMIPTFNPYIQQLPVEEMAMVGMEKQRRYDEGIQKIQSQIDNIAGLDIARNVDRRYLQSRLNQMGNELRTVAAGDFSNFQLVNSTGGMINQVAKDRNIINAVKSTAKYKKAIENREKYLQDGKTAPENDWLFGQEVNDWMNSKDLESQFNSDYRPYVDFRKNAREILKSINPNARIEDEAFQLNDKGEYVLSDAVIRREFKGVPPEQIQQALMAGLTTADFQQMQIEGRYKYSNYSPEEFVNGVNESYSKRVDQVSSKISTIIGKKAATNNSKEKEKYQEMIDNYNKEIDNIQAEYDNIGKAFESGDIEAAKARLFTTDFMKNFSNAFSYAEISTTYKDNPIAQIKMKREQFEATYNQNERFNNQLNEYRRRTLDLKERELKSKEGSPVGGISTGLTQEPLNEQTALDKINQVRDGITNLKIKALASSQFDNDDLLIFRKHLAGDALTPKEQQRFKLMENTLIELETAYDSGKMTDDDLVSIFENISSSQTILDSDMYTYDKIIKAADSKFPKIESLIPEDAQPFLISTEDNRTIQFSPKEMAAFTQKLDNLTMGGSSRGVSGASYDRDKAKTILSAKEYELFLHMHSGGAFSNRARRAIIEISNYQKNVVDPFNTVLSERSKYIDEKINEDFSGNQPKAHGIPLTTPAERDQFERALLAFATISKQEGGLPEGIQNNNKELKPETLELIAANVKTAIVDVLEGNRFQEEKYKISVVGGEGGKLTASFNLSREHYNELFQGKFNANPIEAAFVPIMTQLNRNRGNEIVTTAIDGSTRTTYENAFLKRESFPQARIYGIRGNVKESTTNSNLYSLETTVYNPETGKWTSPFTLSEGLLTRDQIILFTRMVNDTWIYEKLNDNLTPTSEDLARVKKLTEQN